jgi:hypothetical protein
MDALRKDSARRGGFYLITFISSIPAVFLLDPVLNDSNYIVSSGADTRVLWGCFLDLINAIACIGTAVTAVSGGQMAERSRRAWLCHRSCL